MRMLKIRSFKKVTLISLTAVVAIAAIGVTVYAIQPKAIVASKTDSVASVETPAKVESPKTESTPLAETAQTVQPTTATPQAETVAPTEPAPVETVDASCVAAGSALDRYKQMKDSNGNPWYGSNKDALLKDFKKQNPAQFAAYEQCVATGKIQAL
jgi:hypothetical protein